MMLPSFTTQINVIGEELSCYKVDIEYFPKGSGSEVGLGEDDGIMET